MGPFAIYYLPLIPLMILAFVLGEKYRFIIGAIAGLYCISIFSFVIKPKMYQHVEVDAMRMECEDYGGAWIKEHNMCSTYCPRITYNDPDKRFTFAYRDCDHQDASISTLASGSIVARVDGEMLKLGELDLSSNYSGTGKQYKIVNGVKWENNEFTNIYIEKRSFKANKK